MIKEFYFAGEDEYSSTGLFTFTVPDGISKVMICLPKLIQSEQKDLVCVGVTAGNTYTLELAFDAENGQITILNHDSSLEWFASNNKDTTVDWGLFVDYDLGDIQFLLITDKTYTDGKAIETEDY